MKVLGGSLRGRTFTQPPTRAVRPLSDKVRAAIFDVVGAPVDQTVLDAYAGSGAAGFEAASRGAAMVEAVEANSRVARIISANAAALGLDWGYLLQVMTISTWLARPDNPPQARYHLIIADPPYAQLEPDLLERLGEYLLPDGVLVVSHAAKRPSPDLAGLTLVKAKIYGDTALSYYTITQP